MKTKEYLLQHIAELTTLELRSLNRFYLHEESKRACHICRQVFSDIDANFRVKAREAGKIKWVPSCNGCSRSVGASLSNSRRKDPTKFISSRVSSYACRARNEGRPFNLDAQYLIDLWNDQKGQCFYTDQSIDFSFTEKNSRSAHPFQPSLDKKDPNLGYVKGNVVWCAYVINRMKNDLDYDDFVAACSIIVAVHIHKT